MPQVVECGVVAPISVPAGSHNHTEAVLSKSYAIADHIFVLAPFSYGDVAFCFVTGHWGAIGHDERTSANKIGVFITNMHSAAQNCGFTWAVIKKQTS